MYSPKRPTPTSPPAPTRVQNFTIGETADRYSRRERMYIPIDTIRPTTIHVHQRAVNCWKNGWSGGFCGSGGVKTLSSAMFMKRSVPHDPDRPGEGPSVGDSGELLRRPLFRCMWEYWPRGRVTLGIGSTGGPCRCAAGGDTSSESATGRCVFITDAVRTGGSATSRWRPRTAGCAKGWSSEPKPLLGTTRLYAPSRGQQ